MAKKTKDPAEGFVKKLENDLTLHLDTGAFLVMELEEIIHNYETVKIASLQDFVEEIESLLQDARQHAGLKKTTL